MSIRCFIAVQIGDDLKISIGDTIKILKKSCADVKWVKTENLHITLKFLGSIEEDQVGSISSRITDIALKHNNFDFTLMGTGVFPDYRRARVLWVGIRDHNHLLKIANEIEDAMECEGFDRERRPFSPHITIGRVRSPKGIDKLTAELVKYKSMDFGTQFAGSIHLIKSTLKPGGAEYNTITSAPLRRKS
jgi:2'-5' RNA ligase